MRCVSLKTELSWLIGLVMLMTLIINLSILIAHAGPRVRAEDDTSLHLTRELVVTAIGSLQETDDPLPALRRFYESLGNLRHVDVKVMEADYVSPALSVKPPPTSCKGEAPSWFVDLVHTPPRVVTIPVAIKGVNYGRIAIISNPVDELAEVWSDVSGSPDLVALAGHVRHFGRRFAFGSRLPETVRGAEARTIRSRSRKEQCAN